MSRILPSLILACAAAVAAEPVPVAPPAEVIFAGADADHDGSLTIAEIDGDIRSHLPPPPAWFTVPAEPPPFLLQAFATADANGNGVLSLEEFSDLLSLLPPPPPLPMAPEELAADS